MLPGVRRAIFGMLALAALLLSGCIQYDLDIQFDSQTHGQVVQRVQWQGAAGSTAEIDAWVAQWMNRASAVGGSAKRLTNGGLKIVLPFYNGADLVQRFNQFFAPPEGEAAFTLPDGDTLTAELHLQQGNWLVAIHNQLTLRVDLTAVPDLLASAPPVLQGIQLLEGSFSLTTPWGLDRHTAIAPNAVNSDPDAASAIAHWPLTPGTVNEFEIGFWVPSPIGIGAIAIAAWVALGYAIQSGVQRRNGRS